MEMPYRYLDDIATADAAFEAAGTTPEEMFVAAADALLGIMVESPDSVMVARTLDIRLEADSLEMLLYRLLEELVFLKDARRLFLRIADIHIAEECGAFSLKADAYGEEIDPEKHPLIVDIKAVTLYRFKVEETGGEWRATVVVDV